MWGFVFEKKKKAKAPYPYRKKNDINSFLFFLIYEAQIIEYSFICYHSI